MLRIATTLVLLGTGAQALAAGETRPSLFKEYDVLDKRDRILREDHLRDSLRSDAEKRRAAGLGMYPQHGQRNVEQAGNLSVKPYSKNIDSYCYQESGSSTTCGSRLNW
ncbi:MULTISPECIES: hypothetical protein [Burkholderia]|jgi:hypothetical protein|uniref:hypothetical protein n=1 Tax=Burkholderia TaxID=32008 RepID=UPI000757EBB5|nr:MULTISPECIES: hypothetical protein [Burkholderia]KVM63137.1 hypothetical protein WJ59_23565 [Burkholderia gladioli]MBJ9712412.1 hypothetical protein [Burkholderia gladioli]MBU9156227.1 hypothetical protein [Burkholderia gladioli]MBU9178525.1 hypothetical protein [Burkholderia gladioli]MCH7271678.1 hypothetical protein [Burkholderia gladioli]